MKMISKNVRAGFLCVFFGRATSVFFLQANARKKGDRSEVYLRKICQNRIDLAKSRLMQQRVQNWAELHSKFSHGHADACASICADPRS